MVTSPHLPDLIAGPILRRVSQHEIVLTLVTARAAPLSWRVFASHELIGSGQFCASHPGRLDLGKHAFLHCLTIALPDALPGNCHIAYDIGIETGSGIDWLQETAPQILYPQRTMPGFVYKSHIDQVLHGSCRKPHHKGIDGLTLADEIVAEVQDPESYPAMMIFTGDQVYTDDIAGPFLTAVTQVVELLGLYSEVIPGSSINSDFLQSDPSYYHRSSLLPTKHSASAIEEILFSGARKPVFTSINAENHLLTLGEVIAQYLLSWSPVLWGQVDIESVPDGLSAEHRQLYRQQLPLIQQFSKTLPQAQRVMANLPVYMIFDDHDVTDDWNLSRAWEHSAYQLPMARRIIGNALIGYLMFQGWGNAPEKFPDDLFSDLRDVFVKHQPQVHDQLVSRLLKFEGWSFTIDCYPKVVVLDTRTQRWHSEQIASWPSGLMDWESLAEVQQHLLGHQSVILVSPAPVFGVKLIEVVQRIGTWLGQSLKVDAENWMAHPGAAGAMLNMFQHRRTPQNFVILSGDVHYAFASDIFLRRVENSPHIWQVTSSGIANSFPPELLKRFDRFNRWLFASRSPLNWLTRRRRMRIRQRRPGQYSGRYRHQRLVNGCGLGRLTLDEQGRPVRIEHLLTSGEAVEFTDGYESDWVH